MELLQHPFMKHEPDAHLSKLWGDPQSPEILKKLLDWTKNPSGILYYHGDVGTGKTYFSCAFYRDCIEKKMNIRAFKEIDFFKEIKKVIDREWDMTSEIARLCQCDVFILDDMGQNITVGKGINYDGTEEKEANLIQDRMTDWQKTTLFQFIEERLIDGKPTLITSNLSRYIIKKVFDDRFVDRLYDNGANTIVNVRGESRRSENKKAVWVKK